jgi:tetratricopeptide (TPR) repeat protein
MGMNTMNVDSLNIQIKSSATDAKRSIDGLVTSLKNLNRQLGLKEGTKLETTLKSISNSAVSASAEINKISGTGLQKVSKEANAAQRSIQKLAKEGENVKEALAGFKFPDFDRYFGVMNEKFAVPKSLESGTNSIIKGIQNLGFVIKNFDDSPPVHVVEEMQEKLLPATTRVNDQIKELARNFNTVSKIKTVSPATNEIKETSVKIGELLASAREYKKVLSEMKSGKRAFDPEMYEKAVIGLNHANKTIAEYEKSLISSGNATDELSSKLATLKNNAASSYGEIGKLYKVLKEYEKVLSEMRSGKVPVSNKEYDDTVKGYNKIKDAVDKYNKTLNEEPEKVSFTHDVLPNLLTLQKALEGVSQKFSELAQKSTNLFKNMLIPLKLAAKEYVEKFEGMKSSVTKFRDHLVASLTKMSQFWGRTMRTFTFMLVRKAITGIIKEIGNAINSLAKFSNTMGTQFNQSMSNLVADFQYLARSIVSVFAPLIDMIAPIIDAIINKIATLLSYIGMLFAALGGSSTFTKATKTTTNYAKSLDKAAKSANHLTMGIDELNILANSKGGGGGGGGGNPLAEWDNVEIPPGIKKLADTLKKMWDDFLKPIKAAWDKMKAYVKEAWTYMLDQVKKLGKSIWDAFIQVWNEPETIEMIANIFGIIADLMMVIGNLCKNFRESWDEVVNGATRGVQIFEGIRDIFAVLIEHVRNVTKYMVEWSEGIDFDPLLDSVIKLLHSFYRLADFIGGVFEDVMKNVVLEYIEWMTEEGIPHLNNTIAEVLDAFNFDKIREDLVPVETAFENMLENIHTGVTNAMGNLGKQVADFANSQQFTDFMQRIADIMNLISAEDVEKILTGLGQGILDIADAIVKFVNSDIFMAFLKAIDEWLKNTSSKDIAGILKGVAVAIGLFKFGAFVSGGAAKFIGFLASFGSLIKVVEAVSKLVELAGGIEAVGAALEVFGGINAIIAGSITAIAAFFKMWNDGWSLAGEIIKDVGIALVAVGAIILGVAAAPAAIVAAVVAALSALVIVIHDNWDAIVKFFSSTVPAWWNGTAVPFLQSLPAKVAEFLAQIGEKVGTFLNELPGKIGYALGFITAKMAEWFLLAVAWVVVNIPKLIENILKWFRELPAKVLAELEKIITTFNAWGILAITWIAYKVPEIISKFVSYFEELPGKLLSLGEAIVKGLIDGLFAAWEKLKGGVKDFCGGFIQGFKDAFGIASPSKEAADIGDYWLEGLVLPLQGSNINDSVAAFAEKFIGLFKSYLSPEKFTVIGIAIANAISVGINNGLGAIIQTLNNIYLLIVQTINTQINTLSTTLQTMLMPMFTNIFTQFTAWFSEAMSGWWADSMVFWFTASKWDEDIFSPLAENIHEHFELFSTWWDTSMNTWWEDQVVPWFEEQKWTDEFTHILEAAKAVFTLVEENIQQHMETAQEIVEHSCNSMKEAIHSVMDEIDELIEKMKQVPSGVSFHANGFASGGFPSTGSLFFANEAGPELVGTIHGNTAVANNNEITGIREAVLASGNQESELLARLITITQALLDKEPVVIDDRDIARMATSGQGRLGMNIIT